MLSGRRWCQSGASFKTIDHTALQLVSTVVPAPNLPPSRGQPWHLAGIWNTWTDKTTGEVFESYSMLTQNCDAHSLLNMPELDLPSDKQDKRTVVPMEVGDFRTWPTGSNEEAASLVRLPPALV